MISFLNRKPLTKCFKTIFRWVDKGRSSNFVGSLSNALLKGVKIVTFPASSTSFKGQIMSECIYEIIDFPKYHRKNLIDFCPGRFYRLGTWDLFWIFPRQLYSGECITYLVWITFQGRNISKKFGGILENRWFHKYILTLSDLYINKHTRLHNKVWCLSSTKKCPKIACIPNQGRNQEFFKGQPKEIEPCLIWPNPLAHGLF